MNPFFDTIMNTPLCDDVKALIRKWHTLSENMRAADSRMPILLPDLFWIVPSGAGKTTFLRTLTDFLHAEENLMDFYGNVDVFEFLLGYCPPHQSFSELQRLMDTVKGAAGFRNEYRGVMCIDIDEWVGHYNDNHFITFMEYLAANSEHWLIVLCVSPDKEDTLHNLQAFLSMYLRLETIRMDLPSDERLVNYLESLLSEYRFSLDAPAKELLRNTFAALRKNKRFDGYKSAKLLAKDIVYHLYSTDTVPAPTLTAAALENFAANSRYVQNMLFAASASRNTIGF